MRDRCLSWSRCVFDNGVTSLICERSVRICSMTASGSKLTEPGFDVSGVIRGVIDRVTHDISLLYASCQAGGRRHDLSTSASGHRLEVSATRRFFRLMITRGMYTPREPAAGGENSTPAPVQDYVLSSTPVPPTAATIENLPILDRAKKYRRFQSKSQGR